MSVTLPREERFIHPAPQRVDTQSLDFLKELECRNSAIAVQIQLWAHQLMANPNYYQNLRRWPRSQIQRIRGITFDSYHPVPEDFDNLEESLKGKTGPIHHEVRVFRQKAEKLILEEEQYWHGTRWKGGQREMHQDVDAVELVKNQLSGRIAFFGSARLEEGTPEYDAARWMSRVLVQHLGNDDGLSEEVVTGGGPGIMAAGNRGALEGSWAHLQRLQQAAERRGPNQEKYERAIKTHRNRMQSIGIRIELPFETGWNPHLHLNLSIPKFPARKEALLYTASGDFGPNRSLPDHEGRHPAFVVFPGGIGTQDEKWEAICYMQCGKMPATPILMIGDKEKTILEYTMQSMKENATISPNDPTLRIKGKDHLLYCKDEAEAVLKYLDFYGIDPPAALMDEVKKRVPTIRKEPNGNGSKGPLSLSA